MRQLRRCIKHYEADGEGPFEDHVDPYFHELVGLGKVRAVGTDNKRLQQFISETVRFESRQGAKELFPFAKDEETMWLPGSRLEKHGARVVSTVATAVSLLKDLDTLVPVLQTLGLKHVGYKVLPPHYEIVGQAFIATLDDALQTEFTEAVKNAYLKVWKIVQATMIGDNYAK
eukprot:g26022.t1